MKARCFLASLVVLLPCLAAAQEKPNPFALEQLRLELVEKLTALQAKAAAQEKPKSDVVPEKPKPAAAPEKPKPAAVQEKPKAAVKDNPKAAAQPATGWAVQGQPGAGVQPAPASRDAVDLLYLGDTRPMTLRLHVQVDGRIFGEGWNDFIYSLFQYLDRDGDLVLSKEEAERAPSAQVVMGLGRGGFYFPAPGGTAVFREMDISPADGKVTLDELAAYYRRAGAGPVQLAPAFNQGFQGDALTDALFSHLDLNKDGKLSKEELLRAHESLRKLDVDDDEIITVQELAPNANGFPYAQVAGGFGQPAQNYSPSFLLFGKGEFTARLVQQLMDKYDKDKNQKLSPAEIGLEKAVFEQLDANKDGALTKEELAEFFARPPDVELVFRIGAAGKEPGAEIVAGRNPTFAPATRMLDNRAVAITLADSHIDLRCSDRATAGNYFNYRQYYVQQFKAADADKNGYLDQKEVQAPQFQFWRALFPFVDRDGDGKLTEKELQAFLDLQGKAAVATLMVSVADSGRGLFDLLDSTRDGRLGQRKLRTAWARLAPLDRDGDGQISRSEIPRQLQLMVSQGQPVNVGRQFVIVNGSVNMGANPTAAPARGPVWFRKMDRNGDGDVSRREFLGTPEDFKRIDTDGDGLIDLQEAERADEALRKKK